MIGNKVASKLSTVVRDAWKKYESNPRADTGNLLDLQSVDSKTVREILHSLRVNKVAGLDKIPARLVRDAETELAPSITYLINKSIKDGSVPALWIGRTCYSFVQG